MCRLIFVPLQAHINYTTMGNILAIVGRPNVGKSTLFNRLTETRDAIIHSEAGVTRDRHYGKSSWNGKEFSVIDTGGYIIGSEDRFEEEIRKQVKLAVEEADVILFTAARSAKFQFMLSSSNEKPADGMYSGLLGSMAYSAEIR